jgi:2-dehydropantoate 2-reductase
MKFLVVGAGGIGGYFGARLAADGNDVTFQVRGRQAAAMAAEGLKVLSPLGDVHIEAPQLLSETPNPEIGRAHV